MTKAFDFVDHKTLLNKCEKIGIRGPASKWLQSYLKDRKQYVELKQLDENNNMETYTSGLRNNHYGVPQGSILGPLLFLFYINDLPLATHHQCILFADDVSIIVANEGKNAQHHEHLMNSAIEIVFDWLKSNNLNANLTKTKYMTFENYNNKNDLTMKLMCHGEKIEKVDEIKFLGIMIDRNLNWKSHVTYVCNKLNKFVFALKK